MKVTCTTKQQNSTICSYKKLPRNFFLLQLQLSLQLSFYFLIILFTYYTDFVGLIWSMPLFSFVWTSVGLVDYLDFLKGLRQKK